MRSLALVLALAATASAQEAVTPRDLDAPSWGDRLGKTLVLEDKFLDYDGGELHLAHVPRGKLAVDLATERGEKLGSLLAGFHATNDALGMLDKHGRSNVRVTGVARDDARLGRALLVLDVVKLPDDLQRIRARAAEPGADLRALAREAAALAGTGEPGLAELSRSIFERALDAARPGVRDAAAACALARDYRDLAHVTSKAIAVLAPHEGDPGALALLGELDAVRFHGTWIGRDELRSRLGLVSVDGVWMTALHKELLGEIAKETRAAKDRTTSLRALTPALLQQAASRNQLALGMFKTEVAATKGFPTAVERTTDASGVSWDQWILADGTHAYFKRTPGDEAMLFSWRRSSDDPRGDGDESR
jgi:hypothetical protein